MDITPRHFHSHKVLRTLTHHLRSYQPRQRHRLASQFHHPHHCNSLQPPQGLRSCPTYAPTDWRPILAAPILQTGILRPWRMITITTGYFIKLSEPTADLWHFKPTLRVKWVLLRLFSIQYGSDTRSLTGRNRDCLPALIIIICQEIIYVHATNRKIMFFFMIWSETSCKLVLLFSVPIQTEYKYTRTVQAGHERTVGLRK